MSSTDRDVASVINAHRRSGKFIEIDGIKTFVTDRGAGPAVLCLHGVPTSSFLYRKVLEALAARGFRAISFDFPGLGLSDRPERFDYSFAGLTKFCHQVIASLDLTSFHLVVHDIGGPIGFACAGDIREKVESLTILNTWIDVDTFRKPLPMRPFGWPAVGRLQLSFVNHATWYLMFKSFGVHDITGITTAEVHAYVDQLYDSISVFSCRSCNWIRWPKVTKAGRSPMSGSWKEVGKQPGATDPSMQSGLLQQRKRS